MLSKPNDCEYCGGAGFVHPVKDGQIQWDKIIPCQCRADEVNAEKSKALIRSCEFPPMVEDMTFENYKVYPAVQNIYKITKDIASKPGELCWLTMLGTNGIGKTHLGVAVCKAWVNAGIPAKYVFVPLLLDELREGFRKTDDYSYESRFNYFKNVPMLFLDDLGAESSTAWVQEKLETLVDYRLMNKKSTIITSNKTLDRLPPRIVSRMNRLPQAIIINIDAKDYSFMKNAKATELKSRGIK